MLAQKLYFLDFDTCTENQQKETNAEPKSVLEEPETTIVPDLYVMDENGQYHFKSDFLDSSNTCTENSKLDVQKEDAVSVNPSVDAFSDVYYKASRCAQDATGNTAGNATEDALNETLDVPMQGNLLRGNWQENCLKRGSL